jgi:NAD(P)-dependent dehydrogenase (short-subunit alcohol dehydrogenase family)
VVVTGAASGIGAACRTRLRASGHSVIGIDQHDADIVADLGTAEGRALAVQSVRDASAGALHGVVTCAGLAGSPARPGSLLASVNYFGTVDVMTELRPLLAEGGSAVAISSNSTTVQPAIPAGLVAAFLAHEEERCRAVADEVGSMVTYPASKLAVAHWVRREATGPEWAGSGLRLNAIAPGMIDTPMVAGMRADAEVGPLLDMLPIPAVPAGPRRSPPSSNSCSRTTRPFSAAPSSSATAAATPSCARRTGRPPGTFRSASWAASSPERPDQPGRSAHVTGHVLLGACVPR